MVENHLHLLVIYLIQINFKEIVEKIIKEHNKIDILVNNAGITNDALLMRMSNEAMGSSY